jgi:hypothetical protein
MSIKLILLNFKVSLIDIPTFVLDKTVAYNLMPLPISFYNKSFRYKQSGAMFFTFLPLAYEFVLS